METINGEVYYPLILLAAICTPLQGLPNVIIYLMPKYRKLRRQMPNANFVRLVRASVARDQPSGRAPDDGSDDRF